MCTHVGAIRHTLVNLCLGCPAHWLSRKDTADLHQKTCIGRLVSGHEGMPAI